MSTYIISDIHGCNKTFRKALKSVALKKADNLILLGDLIDRGPDSKGVLDTVILLRDHGFNVICIKGNHEQMLIDALDDTYEKVQWIRNGGKQTLNSFLTSDISGIPQSYIDLIRSFEDYYLVEDFILVHAGLDMTLENPFEDKYSLFWLRDWKSVFNKSWLGKRIVIHGHTPSKDVLIKDQFNLDSQVWGIDGGVYLRDEEGYGKLCVFKLESKQVYFQNNIE